MAESIVSTDGSIDDLSASAINPDRVRASDFELLRSEDVRGVDLKQFPGRHEHHQYAGHVYVIELSNNTIKVGRTTNPRQRFRAHAEQARTFELKIIKAWVSAAHMNPDETEKTLIDYGRAKSARVIRDEYFKGLSFTAIVKYARKLLHDPIDLDAINAAEAETWRRGAPMRALVEGAFKEPEPLRQPKASTPNDFTDTARDLISRMFGRQPDGTYRVPENVIVGDPEETARTFQQLADLRGCELDDILDMSWIDMLAEMFKTMVETEALRLQSYAWEHGLTDLVKPQGSFFEPPYLDDEGSEEPEVRSRLRVIEGGNGDGPDPWESAVPF